MTISWGDLVNNFAPGTIGRSKVNFVEFRFEDDGAAPVTFHINEVAAVPQPSSGVVSIVFDDGWGSTYTRARPDLDRFGYRATAVIIRDLVGTANYMTLPQLQALQTSSGWDVAAHADTVADHNAGFANLENPVVEADMQGIKRWLIENGFKRRDLFAWPQGSFTASQMIIARRFFNGIRGTTGGRGGAAGPQETFPPGENGRLRTWVIGVDRDRRRSGNGAEPVRRPTRAGCSSPSTSSSPAAPKAASRPTKRPSKRSSKRSPPRPGRQDRGRGPGKLEREFSRRGWRCRAPAGARSAAPSAVDRARARSISKREAAIVATVSRLQ